MNGHVHVFGLVDLVRDHTLDEVPNDRLPIRSGRR